MSTDGPTSVRAAVLTATGAAVTTRQVRVPSVADGTVVAAVTAAGVCGTDVHIRAGRMPVPLPLIPGHEAVGRLLSVPEGFEDHRGGVFVPGDRVAWASNISCGECRHCDGGDPALCATRVVFGINQGLEEHPLSGGWAERIHLREGATLARVPDDLDDLEVIALGCAGPTAVHALLRVCTVRPGAAVAVQGCGPVGIACALVARQQGAARVIMIGGPTSRAQTLSRLGVADVVLDMTGVDADARVGLIRAETPMGAGADLVIEATGVPAAVAESLEMAVRGGDVLVVGQYTDHGPTPLNPHIVTKQQLRVQGSWAFSGTDFLAWMELLPILARSVDLSALVSTYSLEDADTALDDMAAGATLKPVLIP